MNSYATSAIVEDRGQVHVAGVPFAPGTEVEITIIPKMQPSDAVGPLDDGLAITRQRMQELFRTIKGFQNSPRLSREELYDRGRLR